ncbi:MAG: 2-oxoacid:acceptor oxidoreductase family protein [Thermodesulfovibrio sp.]|nr:2-oxoacid:acceptor oxidoreductase family protein [Thermodesulfovibrio sp.]
MEQRIIIGGSGGQGVLFLGKIIAYAAMKDNREVTWFPSYGAEMRGGRANCTVIISDELIGSPIVKSADYLIVLNEISYDAFINRLVSQGVLIYDASIIKSKKSRNDINIFPIKASEEAAILGNPKFANMVILGAFVKLSKLISIEKVIETLEEVSLKGKDILEINKRLVLRGYSLFEN